MTALAGMLAVALGGLIGCTKKGGPGSAGNEPPPAKEKMLSGTMRKGPDTSKGEDTSSKR